MFLRKKLRKHKDNQCFCAKKLENLRKTIVLFAQKACNNACNSKACKSKACNSKACKSKAKAKLAKAKLAKAKLEKA